MPDFPVFTPWDWYWQVGDDDSRFWSSAAGSYLDTVPAGSGLTRIADEESLTDILAGYGLQGPIVRPDAVNAERDRRLAIGAPITIGEATFAAQVDPRSQSIIGNLALAAVLAQMNAAPFSIVFRDAANNEHTLDAPQTISLAQQAMAYVFAMYAAAWALKDTSPIPSDYTDESYWGD